MRIPATLRLLASALTAAVLVSAGPATAQPVGLERYREDLERRTRDGSWWWTSNEAYRDQDGAGAPEAYGMRLWTAPGGISATGCLWSIRDGQPAGVAWHFQQGWDGSQGRPFVYQAHSSGTGTGFGYVGALGDDTGTVEQDFWWTDGTTSQSRHEDSWINEDTRAGASLAWRDGAWEPNRTYTWERRRGGTVPCGPVGDDQGDGATSGEPDRDPRLSGFDPFIGMWDAPEALLERNPSLAEYFARSWSWGPHGTIVRLGESVHKEDPNRTVFEGIAYWHPSHERVEFTGYNARMYFAFEGHYVFGPDALTRIYTVHYPSDFEHPTYPEVTGPVREFRGELRLVEPDLLEQRTFMRIDGEWVPWPTREGGVVRVRRAGTRDGSG